MKLQSDMGHFERKCRSVPSCVLKSATDTMHHTFRESKSMTDVRGNLSTVLQSSLRESFEPYLHGAGRQ